MKVTLKMLKGSSAGKEVRIPTPKCLIGRSDECHMRPKSEAVSRRHCVIFVHDGKVFIRDLKSRNGTIVNDQTISGDYELKSGDVVQIGPMVFEMVVDHTLGGEKKPKVTSIKEAATRTTVAGKDATSLDDGDISDWLDEADEAERQRRLSDPDTRQLRLDETDQVQLQKAIEESARKKGDENGEPPTTVKAEDETTEVLKDGDKKKKTFGKLPPRPEVVPKDTREAAAMMLKKFFNKR